MRIFVLAVAAAVLMTGAAQAEEALRGRWTVDLSSAGDGSYTQPMDLTLAPDGTVTGSFYQSAIEAGRWRTARGRTCVSFRTTDGEGPYHSAACLAGDHVEGQTWAEHRNFLFNWNAVRSAAPSEE
ncbi:MAG: hypothetical protein GC189_10685 [Alphaproteobacteria bacterium]|nr:hypothetical protein [Alphaproteobacteria bacterium]